jgi:hypothetical protein
MRTLVAHPALRLVALAVLCFAAAVSRRPDILFNPQFWAEDGLIFYQQAHELGFAPTLLTTHAGYLHMLPRLIAGLSLLFPLAMAPLIFNLVGLAAQCLPAIYLASDRMERVAPLSVRLLLGFLYVGVPNVWRIHGNLTNAQWHLCVLCLLILVASAPKSAWAAAFDVGALVLGTVTGPFALFLLPIAAMLVWEHRDRWMIARAVILAIGSVAVTVLVSSGTRPISLAKLSASVLGFCRIIGFQIIAPVFWGSNPVPSLATTPALLTALAVTLTLLGSALMAYVFWRGNVAVRCFLVFTALQLAASLISPLASATEPQWIALERPGATHRYWMLPEVAVSVAVVVMAATVRARIVRGVFAALVVVMVLVDLVHWRVAPLPDLRFADSAAAFAALPVGQTLRIPIPPPKWTFVLTKTEWD